jgi:hypothetical protein
MQEDLGFGFRRPFPLIENTGDGPITFRSSSAMPSMAIVGNFDNAHNFVCAGFQPNGEGLAKIEPRICNESVISLKPFAYLL